MILTYCCLAAWPILIKINFHHFSIYDIFLVPWHHLCGSILCIEFLHRLILIQEYWIGIFVEADLFLVIILLIIEALKCILNIIGHCIIDWSLHSQKGVQNVCLTSLQIINIASSLSFRRAFVLLFHVFEHFVEDVSQKLIVSW